MFCVSRPSLSVSVKFRHYAHRRQTGMVTKALFGCKGLDPLVDLTFAGIAPLFTPVPTNPLHILHVLLLPIRSIVQL